MIVVIQVFNVISYQLQVLFIGNDKLYALPGNELVDLLFNAGSGSLELVLELLEQLLLFLGLFHKFHQVLLSLLSEFLVVSVGLFLHGMECLVPYHVFDHLILELLQMLAALLLNVFVSPQLKQVVNQTENLKLLEDSCPLHLQYVLHQLLLVELLPLIGVHEILVIYPYEPIEVILLTVHFVQYSMRLQRIVQIFAFPALEH